MLTINAENIEIIFLTEINENDLEPVVVYKDGRPTAEVKTDGQGRSTYRIRNAVVRQNGEVQENISVKVKTAASYKALTPYIPLNMTLTPYVKGHSVAWSITADSLEPVK